jgi:hypothetical protein
MANVSYTVVATGTLERGNSSKTISWAMPQADAVHTFWVTLHPVGQAAQYRVWNIRVILQEYFSADPFVQQAFVSFDYSAPYNVNFSMSAATVTP